MIKYVDKSDVLILKNQYLNISFTNAGGAWNVL